MANYQNNGGGQNNDQNGARDEFDSFFAMKGKVCSISRENLFDIRDFNGFKVMKINLLVKRFKSRGKGNGYETFDDFHTVSVLGDVAEELSGIIQRGMNLEVSGKISLYKGKTKGGADYTKINFDASEFKVLSMPAPENQRGGNGYSNNSSGSRTQNQTNQQRQAYPQENYQNMPQGEPQGNRDYSYDERPSTGNSARTNPAQNNQRSGYNSANGRTPTPTGGRNMTQNQGFRGAGNYSGGNDFQSPGGEDDFFEQEEAF